MQIFRRALGNSSGNLRKLCVPTNFPHHEIRLNYLRSDLYKYPLKIKYLNVTFCLDNLGTLNIAEELVKLAKAITKKIISNVTVTDLVS